MNEDLTIKITGFEKIQSSLDELGKKFKDIQISINEFKDAFDISQEVTSSTKVLSEFASIVTVTAAAITILVSGPGLASLAKTTTTAHNAIGGLSAAFLSLTTSSAKLYASAGLILSAFLFFNKFDDMSESMQVFTVTLGIVSTAVFLLGTSIGAAIAPFLIFTAAISGVVAVAALLWEAFSTETDYDKQIKAETEAIEDQTEALKEQAAAYDEVKAKRKDAGLQALAESEINEKMWKDLQELNNVQNKSAEQKKQMADLTEKLNESLGTEIKLTEDQNSLVPESIDGINQQIEAVRAQALAEIVAAEYKEAYTQAFKNANEIRALEAEKEILIAKQSVETLTSAEKDKLKAIEENLTERTAMQEKFSEDISNLEEMQVLASQGRNDELLNAFMVNTQMGTEAANDYSYNRQQINEMMYDGISEQDSQALADALEKIQQNGGDINQFLDENGKLRQDINLQTLVKMNQDLEEKQKTAAELSKTGAENASNAHADTFAAKTAENEPKMTGAMNQSIQAALSGFNGNIIRNASETNKAMRSVTEQVTSAFDNVDLPSLKGSFKSEKLSSALSKIAGLFGYAQTPRLDIVKCAQGALLDPGQLFLAREAGPELVGTIGSHTAVMNNNMIVESVKGGVVNCVLGFVEKRKNILVNIVEKKFIKIEKNFDQTPKTFPIRMKGEKPFLCMETVA